jgi:hypothetical protein
MLMSLPNSVGIDPASTNGDVFKASGRLVPHMSKRGRTGQFVAVEPKGPLPAQALLLGAASQATSPTPALFATHLAGLSSEVPA